MTIFFSLPNVWTKRGIFFYKILQQTYDNIIQQDLKIVKVEYVLLSIGTKKVSNKVIFFSGPAVTPPPLLVVLVRPLKK